MDSLGSFWIVSSMRSHMDARNMVVGLLAKEIFGSTMSMV